MPRTKTYLYSLGLMSVVLWSTFPLAITYRTYDPYNFSILLGMESLACLSMLMISAIIKARRKRIYKTDIKLPIKSLLYACLAGLLVAVDMILYFYAFGSGGAITIVIVMELVPLIYIFLLPLVNPAVDNRLLQRNTVFAIIAFVGVMLASLNKQKIGAPDTNTLNLLHSVSSYIPELAAFLAAILNAAALTLLYRAQSLADTSTAAGGNRLFSVFRVTGLSKIVVTATIILFMTRFDYFPPIRTLPIAEILFLGLIVNGIGTGIWQYVLYASGDKYISVLWYLTPIISIVLLYYVGNEPLSVVMAISGILVLISNFYINYEKPAVQNPSNIATVFFVFFSAIAMYLNTLRSDGTLDVLFGEFPIGIAESSLGVFSIIAGFTIARLNARNRQEDVLLVDLLSLIRQHAPSFSKESREVMERAVYRADDAVASDVRIEAYSDIERELEKTNDSEARENILHTFQKWAVLKNDAASSVEMFFIAVLAIISCLAIAIRYMGVSLFVDLLAILLCVVCVYITSYIYRLSSNVGARDIERFWIVQRFLRKRGEKYSSPVGALDMGQLNTLAEGKIEFTDAGGILDEEAVKEMRNIAYIRGGICVVVICLLSLKYLG